jgi:hypothetical protein
MAYRTIVVCLNDVARLDVLLNLASDIAAKQNAHVIGLYVLPAVRIYPAVGLGCSPRWWMSTVRPSRPGRQR